MDNLSELDFLGARVSRDKKRVHFGSMIVPKELPTPALPVTYTMSAFG